MDTVTISTSLLQKLAPHAAAAGLDLPTGEIHFAPGICIQQPISALAVELGRWCAQKDLFLSAARQIVTIDPQTGLLDPMTPERFGSWCEAFVTTYKINGQHKIDTTLTNEDAKKLLASDNFRRFLRPLIGVNPIRLPAPDPANPGAVRLLAEGYDAPTQTFTLPGIDYPLDWTLQQANQWAESLFGDFPWSEEPDPEITELRDTLALAHDAEPASYGLTPDGPATRRSASVCWALTIGTYCRLFFPAGTPRPLALYLANQPGSGKTRLAQIALAGVFGAPYESDLPTNDDEMGKVLSTEAMNFSPYVFFDDIGRGLRSNKLNRFVTSSGHTGRIMGGQTKFQVPNVSQVFATGNWVRLSPDLQRRTLVAELFLSGEVMGRKFENTLTSSLLASPAWRRDCLAACWAVLQHWTERGQPHAPNQRPSFEDYTGTIGGILTTAGWTDPLAEPQLDTGGDINTEQLGQFLRQLGAHMIENEWPDTPEPTPEHPDPQPPAEHEHIFSRNALTDLAREWELLDWLVGSAGDPDLKAGEARKFGAALKDWRGRDLQLIAPRYYEETYSPDSGTQKTPGPIWHWQITFGRRHSNKGASYPVTAIAIKPCAQTTPL